MRTLILRCAIVSIFSAAALAQAAGLTLYSQPGFAGRPLSLDSDAASLGSSGLQDQASSAVVDFGRWQVCTQPDFKGDCMILERGRYDRLDPRVYHRVESARRVADEERRGDRYSYDERRGDRNSNDERRGDHYSPYSYESGGFGGGSIALFAASAFRGHLMDVDHDMPRLGRDRNSMGVSSVVVNDGTWELCSEPRFQGDCQTFEPGRYRDIGRFHNQVGSIRRVG